jgi:hypothetical protein
MKTFKLFSMAALALTMAACSSEDVAQENATPTTEAGTWQITGTVAAPDRAITRTTYTENETGINVAWSTGDIIFLMNSTGGDVRTGLMVVGPPAANGSATIRGAIKGSDGDEIMAVYPYAAMDERSGFMDLFTYQKGTLSFIQDNLDLRLGMTKLLVKNGSATFAGSLTMDSKIAIWKLTLQNSLSAPFEATKVTVYEGSEELASTRTISATSEVYLALPFVNYESIENAKITIEATAGSDTYSCTASGVNLEPGNFYQSTVTMLKYPIALSEVTNAYRGSVVCSDGNVYPAKTAVPAGKTAVGILGIVTEPGEGLILALQDATPQSWNTVNSWTSVTNFAGTTLKVLPDADARGNNLTSYTALGQTAVSNWAVAQKDDYMAIFFNLGSTKIDENGVPYDDNVNAYITTDVGGNALNGVLSTTANGNGVWFSGSTNWAISDKSYSISVRPVLGFGGEAQEQGGATYTLLSAVTTEDVGKVVCAAGHLHDAKTAVPDGCTAVGILGKVTETGHGLILALQNATSQTWNTVNSWTSVTTYAGTTLKVLPNDAARGANLTSYTTLGATTVSNWTVAQKSDYEAIFTNLGSTKYDDGYTYDGNVNAYITTGVGGTEISGMCWSATEYDANNAWYFGSNYWWNTAKTSSAGVRPVLGF